VEETSLEILTANEGLGTVTPLNLSCIWHGKDAVCVYIRAHWRTPHAESSIKCFKRSAWLATA